VRWIAPCLALLLGAVVPLHSLPSPQPVPSSLDALWVSYKNRYITPAGAAVDPSRRNDVTSEAQSYALLQAVWMRDQATFDRVWSWTQSQLKRPDGLYSWHWSPTTGGIVDVNNATDGDVDLALALAMASVVFERPAYARSAREIVQAIRASASLRTRRGWFPSAGNWADDERVINLSYFYPYAAPWFERLDPGAGWDATRELGHTLVEQALDAGPAALPADFNVLTPAGNLAPLPEGHALSQAFSYDAMRIAWRLELACSLQRDARACRVSETLGARLVAHYRRHGRIVTQYSPTGVAATMHESTSFYAALLPVVTRIAPDVAREWRRTHLGPDALDTLMGAGDRYYDANWVWFGLAAADGFIHSRTPSIDALRPLSPGRALPLDGIEHQASSICFALVYCAAEP
jgi:endo-1,4-beta-D-glucanase Y